MIENGQASLLQTSWMQTLDRDCDMGAWVKFAARSKGPMGTCHPPQTAQRLAAAINHIHLWHVQYIKLRAWARKVRLSQECQFAQKTTYSGQQLDVAALGSWLKMASDRLAWISFRLPMGQTFSRNCYVIFDSRVPVTLLLRPVKERPRPSLTVYGIFNRALGDAFVANTLVAVDPPAKSLAFWGGVVESTFISTKKLKSKDPTQ